MVRNRSGKKKRKISDHLYKQTLLAVIFCSVVSSDAQHETKISTMIYYRLIPYCRKWLVGSLALILGHIYCLLLPTFFSNDVEVLCVLISWQMMQHENIKSVDKRHTAHRHPCCDKRPGWSLIDGIDQWWWWRRRGRRRRWRWWWWWWQWYVMMTIMTTVFIPIGIWLHGCWSPLTISPRPSVATMLTRVLLVPHVYVTSGYINWTER